MDAAKDIHKEMLPIWAAFLSRLHALSKQKITATSQAHF
jgi:hypothetical protein